MVHGDVRSESFTSVHAGVGWPDGEPGGVVVVGRREDGRYHILEEKRGRLFEITGAAVEISSRLLVDTFWIDSTDTLSTAYFRGDDGPLGPLDVGKNATENGVGSSMRIVSRGSSIITTDLAPIVRSVSDAILRNFVSALERVRGMIAQERALINEKRCPSIMYAMRQPMDYALASPVMAALALGLLSMVGAGDDDHALDMPRQWYDNRRRSR
jgi:hypothetical protein